MLDSADTGTTSPPPPSAASAYPVSVEFGVVEHNQRFWAIPVIGILAKVIILIPHLVIISILGYVVQIVQLVLWIPVLFGGKYPEWGYALNGGYLRWSLRMNGFLLGLTDEYPPFTFRSASEDGRPFMIQVRIEIPPSNSRFWAIPAIGIAVKLVITIPHWVILSVLGAAISVVQLVLWAWMLFGGRYPQWGYHLVGGTLRWTVRASAYVLGLTDRYPPFALS